MEGVGLSREVQVGLLEHAIQACLKASQRILEVYQSGDIQVNLKGDATPLTAADTQAHRVIREHLLQTRIPIMSEEGRLIHYEERKDWDYFWLIDPLDGTTEFVKQNGDFTVNIALIERDQPLLGVVHAPVSGDLYFSLRGERSFVRRGLFPTTIPTGFGRGELYDRLRGEAQQLPARTPGHGCVVLTSLSHRSPRLDGYLQELSRLHEHVEEIPRGSSLKVCLVAEGAAHLYPRITPNSEWDTAAGHIIATEAGMRVETMSTGTELRYNKPSLENPPCVVVAPGIQLPPSPV